MKIEHIAFDVQDPCAIAAWYVEHLGMKVVRKGPPPGYGHFLADSSGQVMIEIYNNPKVAPPDYHKLDPAILHLAFCCDDVPAVRQRLIAAGATPAGEVVHDGGDVIAMLRDPWGLPIQLARRERPMLSS